MAFLAKAKKEDLRCLAEEMGEEPSPDLKVIGLKDLITKSKAYEEETVKNILETIVKTKIEEENLKKERERERLEFEARERKERLEFEAREKKERLELEAMERKERMEYELELEKLKLEAQKNRDFIQVPQDSVTPCHQLVKLMPKYDMKDDDIVLFLSLFERQAKRIKVDEKNWVSALLTLLPSEIVQLIARESEEKFEDYAYIKDILLKRFKLTAESFRKKFVTHQKSPEKSWRDFTYEVTNYFQEWINGLEVKEFETLKDLIITDQIKRRVPYDVREHFVDEWVKIISPAKLAERLDEYESVRLVKKKTGVVREKEEKSPPQYDPVGKPGNNKRSFETPKSRNSPPAQQCKYDRPRQPFKPTCYTCGVEGHTSRFCHSKSSVFVNQNRSHQSVQNNLVKSNKQDPDTGNSVLTAKVNVPMKTSGNVEQLQLVDIQCGSKTLKGIIDSGAQISVVREDLVSDEFFEGEGRIVIESAFGEKEMTPLRIFYMKIADGTHGLVPITCAVSKKLVNDLLLSTSAFEELKENLELYQLDMVFKTPIEINDSDENEISGCSESVEILEDPLEGKEEIATLAIASDSEASGKISTRASFIEIQRNDESLKIAWEQSKEKLHSYEVVDDILMHNESLCGETVKQVVLPQCKREEVLKIAHEIPLAGHLGERKTKQRIKYSFFWPTLKQDVKQYCQSCHVCQVRKGASYRDRIPISPIVRPENPFEVWSVDCIGPLEPPSRRGHKYIICAIDLCTRWAEAIPVRNISAKTTCNVLMKIFTQTGFPKVICSDQGTNFTAKLTDAFLSVIGVSPRFSTPGHPESMGAVERWNQTLKDMLNKNIQEHGSNWDLHLPYLLFAYREVPHSTTGVSPFQLVYGRLPPGPLSILKEFWTGERLVPTNVSRPVEDYLKDLIEKLTNAHDCANKNSELAQMSYTSQYNLRSREKSFEVGDKVLLLLPSSSHKLLNTWIGPATIVQLTRPHSAKVQLEDGSTKELHFNKLRPYVSRTQHVGLIFEQDEDFGELHYAPNDIVNKTVDDIFKHLSIMKGNLEDFQRQQLFQILKNYFDVFSSKPGQAKVEGHEVHVTADCSPKRLKPYRVPITLQQEVDRQIQELLDLDLIEPSNSNWAHPVVCVAKKDGSVRLCIDFRLLNSFTIPDAYPMKIAKELLFEVGGAQFISVLDLTKGYWQIPMKDDAKPFTAFVTHSGHYQWKVLPFGMKNAGSTFQKSMDQALFPHRKYCRSYIDDLAIYSASWNQHLHHIDQVFKTLRDIGLTVNLEKCDFGKNSVKFLGHVIGSGKHSPDPEKVEAIKKLGRPVTKKDVRSLLGLASYYRDYIPNFSQMVLPLTNLTKKNVTNNIPWETSSEEAFLSLKEELLKMPSLYTPDVNRPFILFTDASATAIGACLAQHDETGKEMPIAFFSKKLTPCQIKWSTIEREAFCMLEALKKFDTWVFGTQIQIVSDHNPLTFLTKSAPQSAKLTRWVLALQRYHLSVSYRRGAKHGNADALSRLKIDE